MSTKPTQVKVGNKAKSRRSYKARQSGYYLRQAVKTEQNRKRKRLRHFENHPNSIRGFEKLRESLGIR